MQIRAWVLQFRSASLTPEFHYIDILPTVVSGDNACAGIESKYRCLDPSPTFYYTLDTQ